MKNNIEQSNDTIPSKTAYAAGLLLAVALLLASVYIPIDSFLQLTQAMQEQYVLIRFDTNHFFFIGGIIGAVALLLLCTLPLLGKPASSRTHININIAFIVALFIGVLARLIGSVGLDSYLHKQGYYPCEKQSSAQLHQSQQVWTIDEALCESTLPIDNMTLEELKRLLK